MAGAVVATIRVCGMIGAGMSDDYLLGGQRSELDRLRLQSRVWEPAGVSFLERVPRVRGGRALDVGCGAMGWLRALSEWAGDRGEVVGTDIDAGLLQAAGALVEDEGLRNVTLVRDDLFSSALEPASFDLVHARFQLAPLGRMDEQIQAYARLVRDGGSLVLEEPDSSSWHFNPPGPSAERLIALILEAFSAGGGDFDAGRRLPELLGRVANVTGLDARVVALAPGHPYLRLPLQFATALEPRLLQLVSGPALDDLRTDADAELADPDRWGTTFTLIQIHGHPTSALGHVPR